MKPTSLTPLIALALLGAAPLTGTAQQSPTAFHTYSNTLSTDSWNWMKTKADQAVIEGTPQPVLYSHIGTLQSGLRPDSGNANASFRLVSGPSRIDNGLPEMPPEPYATDSGTSYAYPVPSGYTGVFGLYNGDVSAYPSAAFPNAMNVLGGTYTQALVNGVLANPPAYDVVDATMSSKFELTLQSIAPETTGIVFQLRIQGLGPTVANQQSGTYLTTYDVVQQISPLTLTINGGELVPMLEANLLSYTDLGVGSRHSYAGNGLEELWEFRWDLSGIEDPLLNLSIGFVNYPTSVISGFTLTQVSSFEVAAVPEPSTLALLGGGAVLGLLRWRRLRRA